LCAPAGSSGSAELPKKCIAAGQAGSDILILWDAEVAGEKRENIRR
jgi:hypothetical protein